MKTYYYLAAIATTMALASCSESDFVGEEVQKPRENQKEIVFVSGTKGLSRANHVGADAAALLNNRFIVEGTKGTGSVATSVVYDNYKVEWMANSANISASNTADWDYVGLTPYELSDISGEQEIKYWDYSSPQYDFIAYSLGTASPQYSGADDDSKVKVTKIDPVTATNNSVGAYTMRGVTDELSKVYIADLVTVKQANYGAGVNLSFRKLAAKIRLAIYETIPGYSVRDVEFYTDGATPAANAAGTNFALYSAAEDFISKGTFMVYFPTVNSPLNTDNNKAHVALDPTGATRSTFGTWGALDYRNAKTLEGATANYLGETSATATYAGSTPEKRYFNVLPNEVASAYTLRVNYTLVANDASGEVIKVWGANAVIPAAYTQWKSNYAYTYIFKISDKTNGSTEQLGGAEGLQAITFDAVVIDSEEFTGESVNNVCTPSITTYQQGDHVYNVDNDEYAAGDIYLMVQDGATMKNDLAAKGQLYVIDATAATAPVSEATVMDALNMGTADASGIITGRNGIKLTPSASDATVTGIPGEDGNTIVVNAGEAAMFAAAAGTTYAYAYQVSAGTPSTYYTAVYVAAGQQANGKYTKNPDGTYTLYTSATALTEGAYFYEQFSNNNNNYAVKVIKVQL